MCIYIYIYTQESLTNPCWENGIFRQPSAPPPGHIHSHGRWLLAWWFGHRPEIRQKALDHWMAALRLLQNHGETIGKPEENQRKMMVSWDIIGENERSKP